jgi:hypothetical protein
VSDFLKMTDFTKISPTGTQIWTDSGQKGSEKHSLLKSESKKYESIKTS